MTAIPSPAGNPIGYALAIHTASPDLGLAIDNFAGDRRSQVWDLGRDLSTHLHLHLAEFLQPQTWQDLCFLAVAQGPGGFTGTRIGVVAARTLAQQLNLPLFALSTLGVLAWERAKQSTEPVDLAVQMQAQRGEWYTAIYGVTLGDDRSLIPHLADTVLSTEQWQQTLQTWPRPYELIQVEGGLGSSATALLDLAYHHWQQGDRPDWVAALPYYGQHPVVS